MIAVIPAEAGIRRFGSGCAGLGKPGNEFGQMKSAIEPILELREVALGPEICSNSSFKPTFPTKARGEGG